MKKTIINILRNFLSHEIIIESWGSRNFVINENQISFDVSALKYVGTIIIQVNEKQKCDILFSDGKLQDVNYENITEEIDNYIEKTDCYISDLITILLGN